MTTPFRTKRYDETLSDYHEAFFGAILAECIAAGLPVALEPDAECGRKLVITGDAFKSPRKQRAVARQVAEIYAAMAGQDARMAYFPSPPRSSNAPE